MMLAEIDVIHVVSRWLHIGAAIVAIGGAAFARFALLPSLASLPAEEAGRLRDAVRSRWAKVTHICIALLLLTGGLNFYRMALVPKIPPLPYHPIFGVKLIAALAIFFFASALAGRSPGFAKFRAAAPRWLSVILFLAAVIVLLSGVLAQVRAGAPVVAG
jgi:hypothetical protein